MVIPAAGHASDAWGPGTHCINTSGDAPYDKYDPAPFAIRLTTDEANDFWRCRR